MSERPAEETLRLDHQVDWQLLQRVFDNEVIGGLYNLIAASALASLVTVINPGSLVPWAWWAVIVSMVGVRLYTSRLFQCSAEVEQRRQWMRRYALGTTLTGLAWGIGSASMILSAPDTKTHIVILVVVGAMCAAAVAYQGAVLAAYLGYVLGALVPLAVVLALHPQAEMLDIALLALVYCMALGTVGKRYHRDLRATVRLGLENQQVSEQLTRANLQLEADVDARLRAESLLSVERNVLENVARDVTLPDVLAELTLDMEALYPDSLCSVILLAAGGGRVQHIAAPGLPRGFVETIRNLPIAADAGSCGAAMYHGRTVITADIAHDPLWRNYRDAALAHELRACWSTPIVSRSGSALGAFAFYHRDRHEPSNEELETVSRLSRLMALIIEDIRNSEKIQVNEQRFRDFASAAADWFWELDSGLEYTFVSETSREAYDWPKQEILDRTREELRRALLADPPAEAAGTSGRPPDGDHSVVIEFAVPAPQRADVEVLSFARPVFDHRNVIIGWRGVGRDVTRERQLEREIRYQASHDSLTGLANRREFERCVSDIVADESRSTGTYVAFIDLDRFKWVNDNAGHHAGDAVLKRVAEILGDSIPESRIVARLGGDEFGAAFVMADDEEAVETMERLVRILARTPFDWGNSSFRIGASVGLVRLTPVYANSAQVMSDADASCYRAKNRGGNRVSLFQPELELFADDARSTGELITALKDSRALIHVQRICALQAGEDVPWYEVLLRYNVDGETAASPSHLIPAAERYGQMGVVDIWVLEQTLESWGALLANGSLRLSLNLSANSIAHNDTAGEIMNLVEQAGISPGTLCFEITETSTLSNLDGAARFMSELCGLGCRLVLDNFGGGQTNFAYLKSLPGHYLAIDGNYVSAMTGDAASRAIVEAIHKVGRAHGMLTLAKSVETQQAYQALQEFGVDYAQGHLMGEAVPATELDAELARHPAYVRDALYARQGGSNEAC